MHAMLRSLQGKAAAILCETEQQYLQRRMIMNKAKQSVWQNLAAIGKSILAHVSISYDGAKGSLHIDIISKNAS